MKPLKQNVIVPLGLTMFLLSGVAAAQTTAVGPYYAQPSWAQTLPAATRFIVLSNFGSAAVLDRETGLVWERAPSDLSGPAARWGSVRFHCADLTLGGRKGWRLPSVFELLSLLDPSVQDFFALPAGHPFILFHGADGFWTATTDAALNENAWEVDFLGEPRVTAIDKSLPYSDAWCVRGGMNADQY